MELWLKIDPPKINISNLKPPISFDILSFRATIQQKLKGISKFEKKIPFENLTWKRLELNLLGQSNLPSV